MAAPEIYVLFPGCAREALTRYGEIFGSEVVLNTYAEFGRDDGPGEAIAHGGIRGPVTLSGADAAPGEAPVRMEGMMITLLGAEAPGVLHDWFDALAEGGTVIEPLQTRPWGDTDGQVRDAYGLVWLIGYEGSMR
ncbi:MAG: VOC family protein [Actinomycetia bacterium]|nr:VOC family protein [Actinomycetes bacterium]